MEQDYCLKRFFEETYPNQDMYQEYLNGDAFINQEKYISWIEELNERNKSFAKVINQQTLVTTNEEIVESALSKAVTVSEYLCSQSAFPVVKEFKRPNCPNKCPGDNSFHYICNGYYSDTLNRIYQVLNGGAFTVGICCNKKMKFYRELKVYYNQIKAQLLTMGYMADNVEVNVGSYRAYILNYRYKKDR